GAPSDGPAGRAAIEVHRGLHPAPTRRAADGNPLAGRAVTWTSGNTSTATVNTTGLVTGKAAGSATITATSEGKNGTATVTVMAPPPPHPPPPQPPPPPVAPLDVAPATASIHV